VKVYEENREISKLGPILILEIDWLKTLEGNKNRLINKKIKKNFSLYFSISD